ncbi:uncharacterized protein B0I36DRAFT_358302 [Microdochium trichocladiopsis]|uniref:Clr5 domain-containing protein n=1 Tax=Microdochium trichocladiopsis TaxID=1682393 RepID=A0A9P8YG54_9PEZI|nr:uncharacterized protein B0I36DRAFT_358302 [Microdochium trichocladiopsis]KAH7041102.1 hypothetical protein B0I36DRAFT_358302 [Microdochium trichocladiopsis]
MQSPPAQVSAFPGTKGRTASSSPASANTAFKKKQYATPSQWQAQKATIKRLYLDENQTLPEVRAILETDYGFHATINMYKKRLRAWGFTKNIQESEAKSLLIDQLRHMNAQDTAGQIRLGGRQSSDKKLQRYLQRNPFLLWQVGATAQPHRPPASPGSPAASDDFPLTTTPLDSVDMCCSASMSHSLAVRLSAPASTRDLERTLLAVRYYIQTNKVISETPSTQWRRIMLGHSPNKPVLHLGADLIRFHDTFCFVADALNCGSNPAVAQLLQPHFDRIQSLLQQQHPDLISSMMRMSLDMAAKKRPELARIVHNYLLEMTPLTLTRNHPMAVVWASMRRWHMSEGDENMNEFRKAVMLASETEMVNALRARNITGLGTPEGPTTTSAVGATRSWPSKTPRSSISTSHSFSSEDDDVGDERITTSDHEDGYDHRRRRSSSSNSSKDSVTLAPAHEDGPWITERIRNWRDMHERWSQYQATMGNFDADISAIVSQTLDDLSVGRILRAEDGMRKVLEKQERIGKQNSKMAPSKASKKGQGSGSHRPSSGPQDDEDLRQGTTSFTTCSNDNGSNDDDIGVDDKRGKNPVLKLGSVPNLITWIILVLGMARVRVGDEAAAQDHFRWVIANADRRGDLVVRNIGMTMLKFITRDQERRQAHSGVGEHGQEGDEGCQHDLWKM